MKNIFADNLKLHLFEERLQERNCLYRNIVCLICTYLHYRRVACLEFTFKNTKDKLPHRSCHCFNKNQKCSFIVLQLFFE